MICIILNLKDSNLNLEKTRSVAAGKDDRINCVDLKEGLKIPIISNAMFHTMFQRVDCIKYPCKLLSYIVDLSYEELLNSLTFSKTETGTESAKDYEYRNDLVVDIDGTKVIVEMNNNSSEKMRERNVSYMMRIREDRKEKYAYEQIILINLNNYRYKGDYETRRDYAFLDNEGNVYTRNLIIVDIYLPNIVKKCYTSGKEALTEMERFLLIGVTQDIRSALEYVGDDIVMKEFVEENNTRSYDNDLREAYNKEEALKEQYYADGQKEGLEQGIEQGEKNEKLKIARKMLEEKIEIPVISKITSLTIEEISNL